MSLTAKIDIDRIVSELIQAAVTSGNEAEFRIKTSNLLENEVISKLGISSGRHEYTSISGGRLDALYGHLIIEYKAPGKISSSSEITHAKEQLIGYIKDEAETEDQFTHFLGIILSDKIAFVRYDVKTKAWLTRGPYNLNRETIIRLVEAIRGLRKKKLAVEELLRDFGPESEIAVKLVKTLFKKVISSNSLKVDAVFNDWKRLFSQVCAYSPEKLKGLEAQYKLSAKYRLQCITLCNSHILRSFDEVISCRGSVSFR